jgi:predicted DsbA family dithiol-disulfide isomerase
MSGNPKAAAVKVAVAPGTIAFYADITCPWAHVCVHRLHETRARLGLEDRVTFDPRAFPLELINDHVTPKKILDAEIPVAGALEPNAGWQMWQGEESEYPVTSLPALEAVIAAKDQGPEVAEKLDRALRHAFFGRSRTISMRHEIMAIAKSVEELDAGVLERALDDGRARIMLTKDHVLSETDRVEGSPHVFLADGTNVANPGIELHWEGEHGSGFPVVDSDDPSIYERLLDQAAKEAPDG